MNYKQNIFSTIVILLTFLTVIPLGGCPIWWDEYEEDNGCFIDENCNGYCYEDNDCPNGYYCDDYSRCQESGVCNNSSDCDAGYICDTSRHTCTPANYCNDDIDCVEYASYCNEERNICIPTGYCWEDEDCTRFGESFVCSIRGVCEPDEGPCPDGHCGCSSDSECTNGWLCEDGLCRDPQTLCTYNFECPTGTICVNSFCRVDCSTGNSCPTGQVCSHNLFCEDNPAGGGQCVYASDCGDSNYRCVNGYCTKRCTTTSECGAFEECLSGLCRASIPVDFECTSSAECSPDLSCIDHACRMPCAANINCSSMGEFSVCGSGGVCRTPEEVANVCDRSKDCSSGICANGACL